MQRSSEALHANIARACPQLSQPRAILKRPLRDRGLGHPATGPVRVGNGYE